VVLGDPNSGPRYDYASDGQGNVVAVTDSSGNVVASYAYDAFGALTSSSENFPNGWSNPFRYDGAQGVRYDLETGLYWMRVRAYDPALGRFLSHDPLGRLAALGLDTQPYVYAGNNPVNWTDPSGMLFIGSPNRGGGGGKTPSKAPTGTNTTHPSNSNHCDSKCLANGQRWIDDGITILSAINSQGLVGAALDLLSQGINLVKAIISRNLARIVSAAAHVLRDLSFILDVFDNITHHRYLNKTFMQAVRTLGAILDWVTPFVDTVASVFDWFSGGAVVDTLISKLHGFNPIMNLMKRWGRDTVVKQIAKWILGDQWTWLLQGGITSLNALSPQAFCNLMGSRCQNPPPF